MKNRYFKILLIILCCFIISGCSNIKAIRNKQLKKDEVIKLVEDDLNSKYKDLNIELISVDKAYTAENNLIKNAKNYKFKITDKDGNEAYANYKDAFKIDKEIYDYSYIESYESIYNNNNELDYYKVLTEKYINKEDIKKVYYVSDYKEIEYINKVKIVYELNYKIKDFTIDKYVDLLKLGFDLRKYRLDNFGVLNYDDPEVYFSFKDDKRYFYASYYGLMEEGSSQYEKEIKDVKDNNDIYNLKSYINFNLNDEEYNKMINRFNSIGIYLVDNIHSINTKYDNKNAYILINNYTKNNYLMSVLIKFKYDSNSNSYIYQNINFIDNGKVGNFDGSIIRSW